MEIFIAKNNWLKIIGEISMMEFLSIKFQESLQFSDCNFAIKRIQHRSFLENIPKSSFWKKRKKVCSPVVHNPQFYQKSWAHARPSYRSSESSNIFSAKHSWWRLFLTKVVGLKFISAISLKRTPSQSFS